MSVNHRTVQRLMAELSLRSLIRRKKYRSWRGETGKTAPNILNRRFSSSKANENSTQSKVGSIGWRAIRKNEKHRESSKVCLVKEIVWIVRLWRIFRNTEIGVFLSWSVQQHRRTEKSDRGIHPLLQPRAHKPETKRPESGRIPNSGTGGRLI